MQAPFAFASAPRQRLALIVQLLLISGAVLLLSGFRGPAVSTGPDSIRAVAAIPFFSGVFLGDRATTPRTIGQALRDHARLVGSRPAIVKSFYRLDDDFSASGWAGQVLRAIAAAGSANYIALDLRWRGAPERDLLAAIVAGRADAALRRSARAIAAIGGTVLIEPGWEMNGDWDYPWQGAANGADADAPRRFARAWRHVVDLFRREGAANVRWVFAPNIGNPVAGQASGPGHWNWYGHYYPGGDYVDYVGAHGFNAPTLWNAPYRDFAALFDGAEADRMLSDLATRYPTKPIIVGEFAAEEVPGRDKGEWIAAAFDFLAAQPNVVGAVWFHMKKEADWRIDSSPSALAAYRTALAGPRVRSVFDDSGLPAPFRLAAR